MRKRFDRFCFKHRDTGIPNLMLYLCVGTAVVYLFSMITKNYFLYDILSFNRDMILQGQIWRLITYPLLTYQSNILLQLLYLVCYYSLGRAIENTWGTLRFNLFYLSGVLMMDIYCMIFGGYADVYYLNTSLFLSYATMYPNAEFLILFIIPIKAWVLGLFDLVLVLIGLFSYPFPENLFSVISLANYFLFFGKSVLNLIPLSWKANARRLFRRKSQSQAGTPTREKPKVVPFPRDGSYEASVATVRAPYTHKCTICGRTDESNPELEFRYCSRCNGYHCYCQDHISNHTHVE